MQRARVLLVDLNNFARYPSLSIGYLAAVLRQAGVEVEVYAPLMVGVPGTAREARPHAFSLLASGLNHLAATSSNSWVRRQRDQLGASRLSSITSEHAAVMAGFRAALDRVRPYLVMVSTYLMYRSVCEEICLVCSATDMPVLIGGPYFAQQELIADWTQIPGLTALAAGEVEVQLPSIAKALIESEDLGGIAGIFTRGRDGRCIGSVAPPLRDLDAVPYPDFSDFPWQRYPNRIVPVATGRGCGWGVCAFCSDVTSTAGRTFRSRSPRRVLDEMEQQHRRYAVSKFVFTDLKLNSNLAMWRGIAREARAVVPDATWIGAVHVGTEADNGLSDADLRAASRGGCVRLTTGLESGSQRMLDAMKKGSRLESISAFLHGAKSAGISARCTMMVGYPGETAEDVLASAQFLRRHSSVIERVSLNRLQIVMGTSLQRSIKQTPEKWVGLRVAGDDAVTARTDHYCESVGTTAHRLAVMRLLREVHRINARALSLVAQDFEGVM